MSCLKNRVLKLITLINGISFLYFGSLLDSYSWIPGIICCINFAWLTLFAYANGAKERYNIMEYNRCGRSGLLLPKISLGLWHNFGDASDYENMRQLCFTAFDNGITQFDLANNYGPAYGSAEKNFGRILKEDLMPYREGW